MARSGMEQEVQFKGSLGKGNRRHAQEVFQGGTRRQNAMSLPRNIC